MRINFCKRPFVPPIVDLYSYCAILPFLPATPPTNLLEIGCGLGTFSFRYAAQHRRTHVVAVDISRPIIDFLEQHYRKYHENISFLCLDFCANADQLSQRFDVIVSSDVLEHVQDVESFVRNVHRSLAPGGKAVITFPNMASHGVNHFDDYAALSNIFSIFDEIRVSCVCLPTSRVGLYGILSKIYDKWTSRRYTNQTRELLQSRKRGVDCFHESSGFAFAQDHVGLFNTLACMLGELELRLTPPVQIEPMSEGDVRERRLVVVAQRPKMQ